ncbi:hypothetical protein, partial [Xenorhabdus bovienii]|uniref:hypothetical protein n=1 Tax=Xenorhabdus bovienii TaxID=40576 RepID=UPI001E3CC04F
HGRDLDLIRMKNQVSSITMGIYQNYFHISNQGNIINKFGYYSKQITDRHHRRLSNNYFR